MVFPLASAFSLQGLTILVGFMFGPIAVVLFNAYRTMARVAIQFTGILSHALWPEFTQLYGRGDVNKLYVIFMRTSVLCAFQSLLLAVVIYFMSPWLLKIWTHNAVHYDSSLMLVMLIYGSVAGAWHIPRVLLMSTNQHMRLANWFMLTSLLCLCFSWLFGYYFDLIGVILATALSEVIMAAISIYFALGFILRLNQSKTADFSTKFLIFNSGMKWLKK